jgi:hypothetical protein
MRDLAQMGQLPSSFLNARYENRACTHAPQDFHNVFFALLLTMTSFRS